MTRLSSHRFCSNQVRLALSLLAYNLGNLWRRLALPKRIENWSLTSLQQRLVKTCGRLVRHARYYWLLLAEGHLTRRQFRAMLDRIAVLPVTTGGERDKVVGSASEICLIRGWARRSVAKTRRKMRRFRLCRCGWPDRWGYSDERSFHHVTNKRDRGTMVPFLNSKRRSQLMRLPALNSTPSNWYYPLSLCLLGAYANLIAYGFQYPAGGTYNFVLPMANWLRNPSLYPGDPIRDAFVRHASLFWPTVTAMSKYWSMEHVLFILFVLAKLIFFLAIGRLVAAGVRNRLLGVCIVIALALSGVLHAATPIGGTFILGTTSEQGVLGFPILLLAGVFLVEGRWLSAAVTAGLAVYIDAIQFLHTLPAFAIFALVDWRERKRRIVAAAVVGAGIFAPWFAHFYRSLAVSFPKDYISALLIFYPHHITLRWTSFSSLVESGAIIAGLCVVGFIGKKRGLLRREARLEVLAGSYLIVVIAGIVVDKLWLTPSNARLMLLRADCFLLLCVLLTIQIYGANLTAPVHTFQPVTVLLALCAVLLPLFFRLGLLLFLIMLVIWIDPKERAERFFSTVFSRFDWLPASRIVVAGCCLAFLAKGIAIGVPSAVRLWSFTLPPTPEESACYQAQLWARSNTPADTRFLVPPAGCGFRVLSERSSWGEWSDGNAMYFDPLFAETFLSRMAAVHEPIALPGPDVLHLWQDYYRQQSWEQIRGIATRNNLDYIIQFRDVQYPATPAFQNRRFAIYRAVP